MSKTFKLSKKFLTEDNFTQRVTADQWREVLLSKGETLKSGKVTVHAKVLRDLGFDVLEIGLELPLSTFGVVSKNKVIGTSSKRTRNNKSIPLNAAYQYPSGVWRVTTEGDCEGKSIKDLGVYKGRVDSIAARLAGQELYELTFEPARMIPVNGPITVPRFEKPSKPEVHIGFGIDSGTWDLRGQNRPNAVAAFLGAEANCAVKESNYYKAVKLIFKK